MTDAPKTEDPMVAALLREREGLVQRGLDGRVAEVDEQLKLRGYTPESRQAPTTKETGRAAAPKGRRARSPEQA
jgi:hypothetical protein